MSIFKQFLVSLGNIKKYPELIETKMGKVIFYGFLLALISCVLVGTSLGIVYNNVTGGTENIISKMPEFEVKNGLLTIDPIEEYYNDGELYLKVDTSALVEEADLDKASGAILIDSEKIVRG